MSKVTMPEEVRRQFIEHGRRGGLILKKKRGKKYFVELRKKRKSYPRAK